MILIHSSNFIWYDYPKIGYGVLTDAIKCIVKERLNGDYYLEMKYPVNGQWSEYLVVKNIIYTKANYDDPPQGFRIVEVSEANDGILNVTANHITYDLEGVPVSPFRVVDGDVAYAIYALRSFAKDIGYVMFNVLTDKTTQGTFRVGVPSSFRSWFYGKEGSLVDVFRGEWHFNNHDCKLLNHRGSDKGVTVRYGKNLTNFERVDNDENQYSAIWAYYQFTDGENTRTIVGDILDTGVEEGTMPYNKTLCLDATEQFENEPTKQQLNDYAASYAQKNGLNKIKEKLSASFVPTDDMIGNIAMGDTITVVYKDTSFKSRIRETEWDALKERFIKVTIGDVEASLASAIRSTQTRNETIYTEPEDEPEDDDSGS